MNKPQIRLLVVVLASHAVSACGADHAGFGRSDVGAAVDPAAQAGNDADRSDEGREISNDQRDGAAPDVTDASPELAADASNQVDAARPPHPKSTRCGDGIRDNVTEECDEGDVSPGDPCTADCRVRTVVLSAPTMPPDAGDSASVYLGTAPHVGASLESGFAIVYGESGTTPAIKLQEFAESGGRLGSALDVAADFAPIPAANPAVAGLPGGRYAVAWTDSLAGRPEVRVRTVDGRTLGNARLAHPNVAGLHVDPDVLWTGDRLVVAYTDLLDVSYQAFDADLMPIGTESPIAATSAIESGVALTAFENGTTGWAAAVLASEEALQRVVVRSGDVSWSTPPSLPGPVGDRPALVALDGTRLLVVFSVGTDPAGTGTAALGRLMWAVADTSRPGPLASFMLDTGSLAWMKSQGRPSATRAGAEAFLSWTETAGDGSGQQQVFIVNVTVDPLVAGGVVFSSPLAVPESGASKWQGNLHLAASPLFPEGAVISTWEHSTDGSSLANVDLMLDFRPSPFVFLE